MYFSDVFAYQNTFNEPLTYWSTESAEEMKAMFYYTSAFNQDIVSGNLLH